MLVQQTMTPAATPAPPPGRRNEDFSEWNGSKYSELMPLLVKNFNEWNGSKYSEMIPILFKKLQVNDKLRTTILKAANSIMLKQKERVLKAQKIDKSSAKALTTSATSINTEKHCNTDLCQMMERLKTLQKKALSSH